MTSPVAAMGTHGHHADPRNDSILINVNGVLKVRAEAMVSAENAVPAGMAKLSDRKRGRRKESNEAPHVNVATKLRQQKRENSYE